MLQRTTPAADPFSKPCCRVRCRRFRCARGPHFSDGGEHTSMWCQARGRDNLHLGGRLATGNHNSSISWSGSMMRRCRSAISSLNTPDTLRIAARYGVWRATVCAGQAATVVRAPAPICV